MLWREFGWGSKRTWSTFGPLSAYLPMGLFCFPISMRHMVAQDVDAFKLLGSHQPKQDFGHAPEHCGNMAILDCYVYFEQINSTKVCLIAVLFIWVAWCAGAIGVTNTHEDHWMRQISSE